MLQCQICNRNHGKVTYRKIQQSRTRPKEPSPPHVLHHLFWKWHGATRYRRPLRSRLRTCRGPVDDGIENNPQGEMNQRLDHWVQQRTPNMRRKGGRLNHDQSNQGHHRACNNKPLVIMVWQNFRGKKERHNPEKKTQATASTGQVLEIKQELPLAERVVTHRWSTRWNSMTWIN